MTAALRVEKVSKQYRIYERPGDRLKESLTRGLVRRHQEFWALRDVDFEIEKGTKAAVIATPEGILLKPITRSYIRSLRGSLKGKGVMKAMMEDRKAEREL